MGDSPLLHEEALRPQTPHTNYLLDTAVPEVQVERADTP